MAIYDVRLHPKQTSRGHLEMSAREILIMLLASNRETKLRFLLVVALQ